MEPENAIELEAFERLNVGDVTGLAPVFQHVPENFKLKNPGDAVIIIGDVVVKPFGGGTKDPGDEDVEGTVAIVAVLVAKERKPLWQFKAAINARLNKWSAVREGWRVKFTFEDGDGFYSEEDDAYVANYRFKVVAIATA